MQPSDPSEMRDARVGAPASGLARYIDRECGPAMGLDLTGSLKRISGILNSYLSRGLVPPLANLVTLDVANQRVKAMLGTEWGNTRIRLGMSSPDYDYVVSNTLLAVADTLSYYVEPDGDRVKVRFTQGPNFESQIKMEGHTLIPMDDEVKSAVCALLGLVGAQLLPNGTSYAISVPAGSRNQRHSEQPE